MEQDLTQFAVNKILYDDSTGCDEVDNYFATEADTIIDILYVYDLHEDQIRILYLTGTVTKLSCLNIKLLFSMSLYLYFSFIHIRKC